MELRKNVLNPDGRKKGRELVSDRPGRAFDSQERTGFGQTGGARHAYGNSRGPEERAVETLVSKARILLKDHGVNAQQDHLTVLAEPKLMGTLRTALEKTMKCEMAFREKNYAWLAKEDLQLRLKREGL